MATKRLLLGAVTLVVAVASSAGPAAASYAFYVGKNLTADGSVLVGGTGEEVSSHWLEVVPARDHPPGATIRVGVTAEANLPGELIEIPEVERTHRYIAMFYSDYKGFPAPLLNGGLNEHQVAVRDVWATARKELIDMTPNPQRGLNYSDLARLVLERATTARQGVELIGKLIAEHGYASYGGNSHLIADANEGWIVLEFPGGQGLWVAERLGPDDIRASYPGYIGAVPDDYLDHPDYMGSPNLISFAIEQGWYDPSSGEPFDVHAVYREPGADMRDPGIKFVGPGRLEDDLRRLAPSIRLQDMMAAVRDPRIADDEAGYGQVVALRKSHPDLALLWVAPTGSVTAPFIPFRLGVERVLPELGQHRYLTKDAGRTFLSPDFQAQEGTEFAGRLFKRLMYFTCERPEKFLPEVTEALVAFEAHAIAEQDAVEVTALSLYRTGQDQLARRYLTDYSTGQSRQALDLGRALLASIEARTRVLYGIRQPETEHINEPAVAGRTTVTCRDSVDREGPVLEPHDAPAPPPAIVAAAVPPARSTSPVTRWSWLLIAVGLGLLVGALATALILRAKRPARPGS